jgi:glycogen synthase
MSNRSNTVILAIHLRLNAAANIDRSPLPTVYTVHAVEYLGPVWYSDDFAGIQWGKYCFVKRLLYPCEILINFIGILVRQNSSQLFFVYVWEPRIVVS